MSYIKMIALIVLSMGGWILFFVMSGSEAFMSFKSLPYLLPFVLITVILSKDRLDSTALYAGTITLMVVNIYFFFYDYNDDLFLGLRLVLIAMPMLITLFIDGFILRPFYIFKEQVLEKKSEPLSLKKQLFIHVLFISTVVIAIVPLDIHYSFYLPVAPAIMLAFPLLASFLLVKERYYRMLLFKNYIFFTFYIIVYLYLLSGLQELSFVSEKIMRLDSLLEVALVVLYLYIALVRPMQNQYKKSLDNDEHFFLGSMVIPLIALFLIVFVAVQRPLITSKERPYSIRSIHASIMEKGRPYGTLSMNIAFKMEDGYTRKLFYARKAVFKDVMIDLLSQRSYGEYLKDSGNHALKEDLLKALSEIFPWPKVEEIFLSDFVIEKNGYRLRRDH